MGILTRNKILYFPRHKSQFGGHTNATSYFARLSPTAELSHKIARIIAAVKACVSGLDRTVDAGELAIPRLVEPESETVRVDENVPVRATISENVIQIRRPLPLLTLRCAPPPSLGRAAFRR